MYFDVENGLLRAVSTDAHALTKADQYSAFITDEVQNFSFILSGNAVDPLLKFIKIPGAELKMHLTEGKVVFSRGQNTLAVRLVDAQYPNWESVFPKSSPNRALVERKPLLNALSRLQLVTNKVTYLARFFFNEEKRYVAINAQDIDMHGKGREEVPAKYDGEALEIGFRIDLTVRSLKLLQSDYVVFELDTPGRAAVLLPHYEDEEVPADAPDIEGLLMPVMLDQVKY